MFTYFFIYLFPLLFLGCVLSINNNRHVVVIFVYLTSIIIAIPPSLRYHTGWDWEQYDQMVFDVTPSNICGVSGDCFFDILLVFCKYTMISPYLLTSFLICVGFSYFVTQQLTNRFAIFIAFILFYWYGYYSCWSTIRQGLSIVFISIFFLNRRIFFAFIALLTHKTSLLIALAVYIMHFFTKKYALQKVCLYFIVVSIIVALLLGQNKEYLVFNLVDIIGEDRGVSYGIRDFMMNPYPLITGRMVEILFSLFVLAAGIYYGLPDQILNRNIFKLQVLHLCFYLAASPFTVLAERIVLYFDFLHAIAVSCALVLFSSYLSKALKYKPQIFSSLFAIFVFLYVFNRYYNFSESESREIGELTHYERFVPYKTIIYY